MSHARLGYLAPPLVAVAIALCGPVVPFVARAEPPPCSFTKEGCPEGTAKPTANSWPTATTAPTATAKPTVTATAAPSVTAPPKATTQPTASAMGSTTASAEVPVEPTPTPPAPKLGEGPVGRRTVPLGVGDLSASFEIPESWAELPTDSLPEPDHNDQVTVVARKGFGVHDPKGKPPQVAELIVICGKASGEFWSDSIRDAAFTQMDAAVEKEASKYTSLKQLEDEPVKTDGDKLIKPFAADADFTVDGKAAPSALGKGKAKVANTVKLQGLSMLGFHAEKEGKTPDLVACSIACAHLVVEGETSVCASAIASVNFKGTFVPAPKRSALAELLFKIKSDPTTLFLVLGSIVFLLLLGLVLFLVRRKKKPVAGVGGAANDHDEDFDAGYHAGVAAAQAAAEVRSMHASPPPAEGFFDPQTLGRRKV